MTKEQIKQKIDELVSDLACCDRNGCRCWQAVDYLKAISSYCDAEVDRAVYLKERHQLRTKIQDMGGDM